MIVVLGDGGADGSRPLALGLRRLGATVALAALDPGPPENDGLLVLPCAMTSAEEVAAALARAEAAGEPLRTVVLVSAGVAATARGELAGIDPSQWVERVETPLRRTLACFQGSYRRLRRGGGGLVVLVPTASLVGAAGHVPWAAVAEAQRALAKSAGRAWGHEGVTVNCLAVSGAQLSPAAPPEDRPGLPPPSLDPAPSMGGATWRPSSPCSPPTPGISSRGQPSPSTVATG